MRAREFVTVLRMAMVFHSFMMAACFISCAKFEANPYQTALASDTPTDLNRKNIQRITEKQESPDDTLRIIHCGDTQRFNDQLEKLVRKTNSLNNIDFLILAGDITDFGLRKEFEWISRSLMQLRVPYLCVIGNHDLLGNGSAVFEKMFGEKNFAFTYKGYRFIFHDTNGREYGFNGSVPDLDFLANELKDSSANYFIGVSHVPPFNEDFDRQLEQRYAQLLRSDKRFILSLHGHLHDRYDGNFYQDHVRYVVSSSVGRNAANLLKINHGTVINQIIEF